MKPHLGHKMKVGECFESQTKRMIKSVKNWKGENTLTYRRPTTKDFFVKGGRRYYCEVIGCVERRSGWYHGVWLYPERRAELDKRVRWWQFTYLVQILEN